MEKRKNPRIKVQLWAQEKGDNYTCFHLISNLSRGGLFIDKKLPFELGAVLNLELELAGSDEKIHLKSLVVNNYGPSDLNAAGTGLKFIQTSKENEKKIAAFLRQIESKP